MELEGKEISWNELITLTLDALQNPKVGDSFHEMYSFWLFVVYVDDQFVITVEGSPPVVFPEGGKFFKQSRKQFLTRFASSALPYSHSLPWVILCKQEERVSDWYNYGLEHNRIKCLNSFDSNDARKWRTLAEREVGIIYGGA